MNSEKTLAFIRRIYDEVHAALWAALAAFVIWYLAFVVPKLPEAWAQAERTRIQEVSAEHEWYCAKWRMGFGTRMHDQCILDLQEFRNAVEKRISDENNPW